MGREEIEGHPSIEIEDGSFVATEGPPPEEIEGGPFVEIKGHPSDWMMGRALAAETEGHEAPRRQGQEPSTWMPDAAPLAFQMSDGGTVEVTHDYQVIPDDQEGLGLIRFVHRYDDFDVWVDRQLTYTNGGTRIVFEVVDGVPGCVSITLKAQDRPIRQKDLTATKLDQIRDEAYQVAGMLVVADENMFTAGPRFIRKALNTSASRRKITPDFLRRVAEIYQSIDRRDDAIEAMKTEFHAGDRQVERYIEAAKKKGFITEPPSAKKAAPAKKASAKKTATSPKPRRKS